MQNIELIENNSNCVIAFCPVVSDDLTFRYADFYNKDFKSAKRKKEWLTTHFILENIFQEKTTYSYNNLEKPILVNRNENISISHCSNYVAVISNSNKKVGIDIEEISPRIHKIAHKFLHTSEKIYIENELRKTEMLYLIWCAKEAIYKVSDTFLDFANHIIIEKFIISNENNLKATIVFPDSSKNIELQYIINDKFVIVWVID